MTTVGMNACFGIELLGMCKYDPQAPSPSYFTIGDAVAALAFTLAIQQFFKPIYLFRLRTKGIKLAYPVMAVFAGAICTIIAAAVPSVQFFRGTPLGYPLNWEIAGGLIVGIAYAIVTWLSLSPAVVTKSNLKNFTLAAANLLSEATDEDRLSLANDIFTGGSIKKLVEFAAEFKRAKNHALTIEFEKLREQGRESEGVRGSPPVSAYYRFERRHELDMAGHAWHFLQLLSDRDFCRVVICRQSWGFLRAIIPLTEISSHTDSAKAFVQGVAWQALVQDDGMLAREDGYEGFGKSQSFANEFFGNSKMRVFELFNGLSSLGPDKPNARFVSRLNIAANLMVQTEIKHRGFWDSRSTFDVTKIYKRLCHELSSDRSKNVSTTYHYELLSGITDLSEIVSTQLDTLEPRNYDQFFIQNLNEYHFHAVEQIADLLCEGLKSISKNFDGIADPSWSFAIDVRTKFFNDNAEVKVGLSPLQQVITIKLIDTLKLNMDGYYPTLSRVLLAMIGPYKTDVPDKQGTAYAILKKSVYYEFQRLPKLNEKDPEKVKERLPPNVTYDPLIRSLIHTYTGGQQAITKLNDLNINPVDLLDKENLRYRG
jgi:hypothetical protein